MASTDAKPIPKKNAAYRVTFPILDANGDLVAGATGLDSEVSLDGGGMADCTNEAVQIATSSGMYYLDLTAGEMNADTVAVIVKSTEGKTVPIIMYPVEADDIPVAVTHWVATAVATPTVAGVPEVDLTHLGGVEQSAADLKDFADAGYDPVAHMITGISGTKNTLDDLNDVSASGVNAEVADVINTDAQAEPAAVPAANAALSDKVDWLFALARNKVLQTAGLQTLRNDADGADIATATVSDDGTTTTRAEWV